MMCAGCEHLQHREGDTSSLCSLLWRKTGLLTTLFKDLLQGTPGWPTVTTYFAQAFQWDSVLE